MEGKKIKITVLSEDQYDKIFEEIKSISKELSSDEVLELYKEKIPFPVMVLQEYSKDARDATSIYRVRVQKEGEEIDIHNPAEFSYPPEKFCRLQRCNFEGQAVFYGALDPVTPFREAQKVITPGKSIIYLSKWGIKDCPDPLFCQRIFYGLPETEEHAAGIFSAAINSQLKNVLSGLSEDELKLVSYFLKKYQELFTSPEEEYYHITASLVNDIFKNWHGKELENYPHKINVPIFSYPSIAQNRESMNYAITTDFVDKYMYLKYVDKIILQDYEEDGVNLSTIERGIIKDGKIEWVKYSTKILNDPFAKAQLFKGDVTKGEYYSVDNTDDKFLKTSDKNELKSIRDYFTDNNINMNTIIEYVNELVKQEKFDFTQSNYFEKNTGIALPIKNFFFEHPKDVREKIEAIGIHVYYSVGFHF